MTGEQIGQILGIVVTVGCIVIAQFPKKWQILGGQAFINVISAINMYLLGQGLVAAIPCIVASVHCTVNCIINIAGNKKPSILREIIFSCFYIIGWGIGFYISFMNGEASPFAIMPLIAVGFFIAAVLSPTEQMMRIFSICNACVYVIYNIIYWNSAVFAHIFTIISFLIAIFRYREKKDQNKQKTS